MSWFELTLHSGLVVATGLDALESEPLAADPTGTEQPTLEQVTPASPHDRPSDFVPVIAPQSHYASPSLHLLAAATQLTATELSQALSLLTPIGQDSPVAREELAVTAMVTAPTVEETEETLASTGMTPRWLTSIWRGWPEDSSLAAAPATDVAGLNPWVQLPRVLQEQLVGLRQRAERALLDPLPASTEPLVATPIVQVVTGPNLGIAPEATSPAPEVIACAGVTTETQLPPTPHQIWVNGHLALELPDRQQAEAIATTLETLILRATAEPLTADAIQPTLINGVPGGRWGDHLLFTVTPDLAAATQQNATVLAIAWVNQLRSAWQGDPLSLAEAQAIMYGVTDTPRSHQGLASWYGPYFHGRLTATGETFDQGELTAAHPTLPFDTYLRVTNLENGQQVVVRVNDRGPYVDERSLDLSLQAARCLGSETAGVIPYEAVVMTEAPDRVEGTAIAFNPERN